MGWTDEQVKELKRLWEEGKSTGEIGKILGVSKNAVVGKAHRLDLESRPSPIKRDELVPESSAKQSKPEKVKDKVSAKTSASNSKAKAKKGMDLVDLTSHSCRWPIGDPKDEDFHFCGQEAMLGKPYCEKHIAEAFVGINKK